MFDMLSPKHIHMKIIDIAKQLLHLLLQYPRGVQQWLNAHL